MPLIQKATVPPSFALFELGFRPFFGGACLFAILSILGWMGIFVLGLPWSFPGLSPLAWHGHEMIFGYALAVVAGFLLTAVANWTGLPGLRGTPLALLFLLWLLARLAFSAPEEGGLVVAALADLLFAAGLAVAVARPVLRMRQWQQVGILSKLVLLLIASGVFYAGALGYPDPGVRWGLYGGLYLILGLLFTMARRVLPFFIERGVTEPFQARNRAWVDRLSIGLFLIWALLDLFTQQVQLVAWLSLVLALVHGLRLWDWHTPGIWRRTLLWSLYCAYGFLVLGFLLKALLLWAGLSPFLGLHAFAYGGIGLMTLGMMARVSLGHTGRNVLEPPRAIGAVFLLILAGALIRVLAPLFDAADYRFWIACSQVLWLLGFGTFGWLYLPMLVRPRLDGRRG